MSDFIYLEVKDVYDLAYDIAQNFEKLTNLDIEEATPLINKVISALELLENSVKKIDIIDEENAELKAKCTQLLKEKKIGEAEKINLRLDFEELEESWSQESCSLNSLIKRLKAENRLLLKNLEEQVESVNEIDNLKSIIEEQAHHINRLKRTLEEKSKQIVQDFILRKALKQNIDELRKWNKLIQAQYRAIKSSKLDNENKGLKSHHQGVHAINKEVCDEPSILKSQDRLEYMLHNQQELEQKIKNLELELTIVKQKSDEYKMELLANSNYQSCAPISGNSFVQQIFQLFLGIYSVGSHRCWAE